MTTITTNSTIGIELNPASYMNPVVIASGVTITNPNYSYGVYRDPSSTVVFTIQNSGTVSAAVVGVYLAPGGSVTNASSGSIASSNIGVEISKGAGTVVNNGDITGVYVNSYTGGATGTGIYLRTGGSVTNTASASIVGGTYGVNISGGGTVVNHSTITGDSKAGVLISGGVGSLVNYGGISSGWEGVGVLSGGSVTNAASASITGYYTGVVMYGGAPGTLVNYGSIAADAHSSEGVLLGAAGGSVINEATGSIINALIGVQGSFLNAANTMTVVNSGDIIGGFGGVAAYEGGLVFNSASGTITGGSDYGNYGVRMTGTLTNAGSIIGNSGTAVAFVGTNSNRLVLDPGFGFSGVVFGSTSASNTLELAGTATAGVVTGLGTEFLHFGSIVFDPGSEWSIAGVTRGLAGTISGFAAGDTIEVDGVTATGSSYAGGILTLDEMGGGSATLDLPGPFSTASFDVTNVAGGTDVSLVEQTVSWINSAGGDWTTGSDWNTGTVPTSSKIAAINAPGSYTVTVGPGEKDTAFGLNVAAGVTLSVAAGSSLDLSVPATIAGTLINAGTVSDRNATAVTFASTADRLILDPSAKFTGTVVGGGANTTLELTQGSGRGILNALGTTFTDFGAVTVDTGATWTVEALASALAGTTITGSGGSNLLEMISAGTFSLGGVSDIPSIYLASGNNAVTVTDTTLSGGSVTLHDGQSSTDSISAAGDTAVSKGKTIYIVTGPGPDSFTGGFENDTVYVSAAAVGGDTLTGGSGSNALVLTSAGTVNLGGVSRFGNIYLAAGTNAVTVADATLSGGSAAIHDGASGTNSVSAADDTSASKGKILYYVTGLGPDSFTGGFENDTVYVSAAGVGGDTLTGGSGTDVLVLTTAGTVDLAGVSDFPTIYLAAGTNTVTVTDATLSGGAVTLREQPGSHNSISATDYTAASKGKTLYYIPGTGTDSFTGRFENDTIYMAAGPALTGDTFTGGSGTNAVVMESAGTVDLDGVSKFANVYLTGGNNTVTVTDTTLSGGSVAVHDGPSGNNSVSAAGDTAASKGKTLYYFEGKGNDSFTGGFENDTVYAGSGTDTVTASSGNDTIFAGTGLGTFTAGSGSDKFVFMADNLPTQTLDNFQVRADDLVVYGLNATNGFDLGGTDNGLNPLMPEAIDPSIFVANASGTFTSASQRFAYDTTNGDLFYSAIGSNTSENLVATLTGAPAITAGNILFQH